MAFPNHQHAPAESLELLNILVIPLLVSAELRNPVIDPRLRNMRIVAASVLVPKAAPNLNNLPEPWKDEVRLSWELRRVQAESVAQCVHQPTYFRLWHHPCASDAAHILAAPFGRDCIYHCLNQKLPGDGNDLPGFK